jgi:hypothetical protein
MRLNLDTSQMRTCMALWRGALALPARGCGGAHKEQEALLARVTGTVSSWSDLLRLCGAEAGEEAALKELSAEVQRFKTWIEDAAVATKLARDIEQLNEQELTAKRMKSR